MKKNLCLLVFVFTLLFSCNVFAATSSGAEFGGENVENQNYTVWSKTVKSYLVEAGKSQLMRFQADALSSKYLVEYYDKDYNYLSTVEVDQELSLFGGFYDDGSYYYVLSGQENPKESDTVEVFRLTKYDHNWNRLGSTGLKGANTYTPFDAGSARMVHAGNQLFIRTSHEMYKSSDGYRHQANVTIQINTKTMKVVDSFYKAMNVSYGYVSHSMNQFIRLDNGHIVGVDHGDAYPRSVVLCRYTEGYTESGFDKSCKAVDMCEISGTVGDSTTGVSVGGFEVSSTSYLVAGNSVKMGSSYSPNKTRNIFVSVVDRKLSNSPKLTWITSYDEDSFYKPTTPHLVNCRDDTFLLMWTYQGYVHYCKLNNKGTVISDIFTMKANLSDCVPLITDQKAIWYVWDEGNFDFYSIDLTQLPTADGETVVKEISATDISLRYTSTTYTGDAKCPGAIVVSDGKTLVLNQDYKVSYYDNVNAGTAKVVISGIEAYTGSVSKSFTILKASNTITATDVIRYRKSVAQSFILKASALGNAKLTFSSDTDKVRISDSGLVVIERQYYGTATITIQSSATSNYKVTRKTIKIYVR